MNKKMGKTQLIIFIMILNLHQIVISLVSKYTFSNESIYLFPDTFKCQCL